MPKYNDVEKKRSIPINKYDKYLPSVDKLCSEVRTIIDAKTKNTRINKPDEKKMSTTEIKDWEKYYKYTLEHPDDKYDPNTEPIMQRTAEEQAENPDEEMYIYDSYWGMSITKTEKTYLEDYITRLQKEKDLSSVAAIDMAKKLAKYSLLANQAMENYRLGKISLKELNDTQSAFENLSKTSNLAPSKTGNGGFSISEIALYIETHNQALLEPRDVVEDDIDKIINIYRNILEATATNQ